MCIICICIRVCTMHLGGMSSSCATSQKCDKSMRHFLPWQPNKTAKNKKKKEVNSQYVQKIIQPKQKSGGLQLLR